MNALGQRTAVAQTGSAFPTSTGWNWSYDSLGQVTSAEHATTPANHLAYAYDAIGNRLKGSAGVPPASSTTAYTSDNLNQYTAVGTVTPIHDANGNMTSGQFTTGSAGLVWNAKNRLTTASITGGDTVHYTYDSQSRRVARTVGTATTLFVYDAWNVIAEYQNNTLSKTHLWGTDLSGSFQGAGGVGGLLATTIHNSSAATYYPTFDGNGNVSDYLDSTGTLAAHFEYDPFGNTVVNSDVSGMFPYRFSTKPVDSTTGIMYYGYRYYDPITGRWPSRDRMEEHGGYGQYWLIGCDPINLVDVLGLFPERTNCSEDNYELELNNDGPPVSAGVGVSPPNVSYRAKFEFIKTKCDECCSDGTKKEVRDYQFKAGSGGVSVTWIFGAWMSGSTGPIGVEAWAGVKAEGEFDLAVFLDGIMVVGGCEEKNEIASGVVTATGTISVEGGFEARVWFKKLSFNLVKGVVDGEIVGNFSVGVTCGEGGCSEKGINDASLTGQVYGEVCFAGWCHRENLLD